jgi:hypothetical protein
MPASVFSQADLNPRASVLAMAADHVHVVGGAITCPQGISVSLIPGTL